MKIVFYMDVIFIINFMTDLFVLFVTGFFMRQSIKLWRLPAGAFFGAAVLLPFLSKPCLLTGSTGIIICTGISMGTTLIAFGRKGGFIRKWFLSTTIMFLLGGIMYYIRFVMGWTVITLYKWGILFCTGCIACITGVRLLKKSKKHAETVYFIKIIKADKTVYEYVYLDTGNMLWDALYQKPVILLSEKTAKKCLSQEEQQILEQIQKEKIFDYRRMLHMNTCKRNSFHVVRYQSVGKDNGWLVCFLADEVWIDDRHCLYRQPLAVAPEFLFRNKKYKGLLHQACI